MLSSQEYDIPNIVSHKIDLTAYGLHRDQTPAWEFIYFSLLHNPERIDR